MDIIAAHGTTFLAIAVIFGLFMTWGIGANDVANALGTSVGSGAVTVRTAIIIAAIFEFLGAAFAGGHVTKTIRKGIIDPTLVADQPEILVFGMLAALLAAAIWLMIASIKGWPVSTTHAIVGALVGFGIAGIGIEAVNWGTIGQIAASWVISPLIGPYLLEGFAAGQREPRDHCCRSKCGPLPWIRPGRRAPSPTWPYVSISLCGPAHHCPD